MISAAPAQIDRDAVVVLDIDDTLYLERDYVRSGFDAVSRQVAASHRCQGLGEVLWAGFEAGVRGDSFNRALATVGIDPSPALLAHLVECYRGHQPSITLLADAARFLDRLGSRACAVITDGPAVSQRAKARALGLDGRVPLVLVTAELGSDRGKPAPDAYLAVEATFGAPSSSYWYVADNPAKDFVVPLARGWHAIRVRRAGALHRDDPTPAGVVEIASLDQLVVLGD
jgi:putative hydrolase of the HAD superfamily